MRPSHELLDWTQERLQQRIDEGERLLREIPREWGWGPLVRARLGLLRIWLARTGSEGRAA